MAADNHVGLSTGQFPFSKLTQRLHLGSLAQIAGLKHAPAPARDPLGQRHRPVGMHEAEEGDNGLPPGEAFINTVGFVIGVDSVAVNEQDAFVPEGQDEGAVVNLKPELFLEETARPEIVVAHGKVHFDAAVTQIGQGPEDIEIAGKNDVGIFEPEVEEVPHDDNAIDLTRIDTAQE